MKKNYFKKIKTDGIIVFLIKTLRLILRKLLGIDWISEILFERSLEEPIQERNPRIKVTIREATEDDLDKFKGIVTETKFELFRKRFKKDGSICLIALDRERIACFAWISFEDEFESNAQVKVKLGEKEAYCFDAYTMQEYRNSGLHTAIFTKRLMYSRDKGYKKVLTLVQNKNVYSIKTVKKVGFRGKKIVTLVKLFGLKFHIWRKFKEDV